MIIMIMINMKMLSNTSWFGPVFFQGTASESTLMALLAARSRVVKLVQADHPEWSEVQIMSKLVAYMSSQVSVSVCTRIQNHTLCPRFALFTFLVLELRPLTTPLFSPRPNRGRLLNMRFYMRYYKHYKERQARLEP